MNLTVTSALLQQELYVSFVLFLLLCESAVRVQLLALQSCFQPPDQVLLLLHPHLQLSQGHLQLPLFLSQGYHLHKNSQETRGKNKPKQFKCNYAFIFNATPDMKNTKVKKYTLY